MDCLTEQGRDIRSLRALRSAVTPEQAHGVIADALPPLVAAALSPAEYENVRQKLLRLPDPPAHPRLGKTEWLGGLGVFFWVFVTTFPVAIPFIFTEHVALAMRLSNGIAVALLFVSGFAFGRIAGYHPWLSGVVMVALGCVLVAATIALGG
jgi:VIT1/CCC1 family predicted Fe2+/Mn2+ transporter